MILNKEVVKDIFNMAEHYAEDAPPSSQYHQLMNMTHNVPNRFAIEIKRVELVPDTMDVIINIMVKHILELYDADEDTCNAENAVWEYLDITYKFNPEEHDLLKATFEEAISYAIKEIGIAS